MVDLSLNTRIKNKKLLVENKISFSGPDSELSIYDTYKKSRNIGLQADQLMYCGMISGKKIMHNIDTQEKDVFLPYQSYIIRPKGYVEIDFPEAKKTNPTTCLTIEISKDRVYKKLKELDGFQHLDKINANQDYCYQNSHFHHTVTTQQLLNKLTGWFTNNHPDKQALLNLGIDELVITLLRKESSNLLIDYAKKQPDANSITAVIDYLKNNIKKPFDIDKITQIACMSRSLLYQTFKAQLHSTPCEFYWKLRLQLAAKMLQNGKSITYVCYSVGFKDPAHFSRRFTQLFGYSPKKYQSKFFIKK